MLIQTPPEQKRFDGEAASVMVLSRSECAAFVTDEPHVVISFTDPGSPPMALPFALNRLAALYFSVSDIDWDVPPGRVPFSLRDGNGVGKFVLQHYAEGVRLFVVHCEAGISRSAGCAAAIALHFNQDDEPIWKAFLPNTRIFRSVLYGLKDPTRYDPIPDPAE